jgi:hypothetical protein
MELIRRSDNPYMKKVTAVLVGSGFLRPSRLDLYGHMFGPNFKSSMHILGMFLRIHHQVSSTQLITYLRVFQLEPLYAWTCEGAKGDRCSSDSRLDL